MKKMNIVLLSLFLQQAIIISSVRAADPGRVQVANGTVVNAEGELLRGPAIYLWRARLVKNPESKSYAFDPDYYQALVDSGVNAIRLGFFDPWAKSNGHIATDFTNQSEVDFLLQYTDSVVEYASQFGMNVVINYHDVGTYDKTYLTEMWTAVAPHYKNRTHVSYEIWNEPVFYMSEWNETVLRDMKETYELIVGLAPNTHVILFSFAWIADSWSSTNANHQLERFENLYSGVVDWTNASVGFHGYAWGSSKPIMDVKANYPIIATESNFNGESDLPVANRDAQTQSCDGYFFIHQHHERYGVSWLNHKTQGSDFYDNWPLIIEDAKQKGYIWYGDRRQLSINYDSTMGYVVPQKIYARDKSNNPMTSGQYRQNTNAELTAIPDVGYRFDGWGGDIGGATASDPDISVKMDSDKTVSATFSEKNIVLSWEENFEGLSTGTTSDEGETAWTVEDTNVEKRFEVNDGTGDNDYYCDEVFFALKTKGEGVWKSRHISLPGDALTAEVSVDLSTEGSLEPDDYIKVYYTLDGAGENLIVERYGSFLPSGWETVRELGIDVSSAESIQVVIKSKNSGGDELYFWDNIRVAALGDHTTPIATPGTRSQHDAVGSPVELHPNPLASGRLTIKTAGTSLKSFGRIEIRSLTGRVVYSETLNGKRDLSFSSALFEKGFYLVSFIDGKATHTRKLLVLSAPSVRANRQP